MHPDHPDPSATPAGDPPAAKPSRWSVPLVLVLLLLVGGALTTGLLSAFWLRPDDNAQPSGGGSAVVFASKPLPANLFRGWPAGKKPDVAIVLSGQQHSYLKFCGCSRPQLGGFERRYNFFQKLAQQGWPLVAADLGDLVVREKNVAHDQSLLKYETAMKSLEVLRYAAITLGQNDYNLPLIDGLGAFTLQKPDAFPRVIAANLDKRAVRYPHPSGQGSMIRDWQLAGGSGAPLVGIVGLTGRSVIKDVTNGDTFLQNQAVLNAALKQMADAKVEVKVLLFQGVLEDAKVCAQQLPQFDIMLCLSAEDEPPGQPDMVGNTMIVRVGHRGRYVGIVGAFRTGKPNPAFELHYASVAMGEELETDEGKEKSHPIVSLLQQYAEQVRDQDFLSRTPKQNYTPPPALGNMRLTYVGSAACLNCHQQDALKWKSSKHSHAMDALEKVATKPTLRQYDPECVTCHVVGYQYVSGYVNEKKTPHLKNVGCESCHGPGSGHVAQPADPKLRAAMSPWRSKPGELLPTPAQLAKGFETLNEAQKAIYNRVNDMCQKCHDIDNDPHFKFEVRWPEVIHGKNIGLAKPAK